jgi:hypothetical protein
MRNAPSLKQIKRIPIIIFVMIFAYLLLTLFFCHQDVGNSISFNARLANGIYPTLKKLNIADGNIIVGVDGRFTVNVKSFADSLKLSLANNQNLFSFYDLFYLLILNTIMFITVYNMDEDTMYSSKTIRGVQMIMYLIVLAPIYGFLTNLMARSILEEFTKNQLTIQLERFSYFKVLIGVLFVRFIPLFISKGKSLQKEQELTI